MITSRKAHLLSVSGLISSLLFVGLAGTGVSAAETPAQILSTPPVQAAMKAIETNEPHFVAEQMRLCEIESPPFHEDKRGAELARLFKAAGLETRAY